MIEGLRESIKPEPNFLQTKGTVTQIKWLFKRKTPICSFDHIKFMILVILVKLPKLSTLLLLIVKNLRAM